MGDFIKLLPDNIANQIAAGEVIQRPASVIKELLENSIDAGADKIEINIKDSGKTLIQVVDNGSGMSSNDALLCFQRHATSKVRKAEDLFSLTTKGFRGEALASIAAISHVEMKTKTKTALTGQLILVEGSKVIKNEDTVCPVGTSFEVKNLFYNVPARRNFLKRDSTEFAHIQDEFERIALAHPNLHVSLIHNGTEIYNLHPAILRKRIQDILGRNSNDKLVPIEESTDIVTLKGFVLKPEHARKTRGDQFFFVNDRYFKSPYFNHAIGKAFDGLVKNGDFPGYYLYLTVDPKKIDVNVHPTKTEIKFEEEKFIYSILMSSVRQALGKYNIVPTIEFDREGSFDLPYKMLSQPPIEPKIKVDNEFNPFNTTTRINQGSGTGKKSDNFSKGIVSQGFGNNEATQEEWKNFYSVDDDKLEQNEINSLDIEENKTGSNFLLKGNYVITTGKSGLLVIHVKRAIEQIVYNDISKSFISKPIESQILLFPIEKEISKHESLLWEENANLLKQLGFESTVEKDKLLLTAVPAVLQDESISTSIDEIFKSIGYQDIEKGDIAHTLVSAIATSASMKQANLRTNEAIQGLVDQLFQCENHMYSPRNKKIIETVTVEELYHKFN